MAKNKTPSLQPSVVTAVAEMDLETAENVVSMATAKGKRSNRFEREDVELTEAAQTKVQLIQHIQEKAEEANKLIEADEANESTVGDIAVDIATTLYRGRTQGVLSPDEVSTLLGDNFGWKGKGDKAGARVTAAEPDKTRSKTPFGWGEAIRKRVVRAVGAHAFVTGNDAAAGAFFKGLEPETVEPILNGLNNGNRSIWTVYDDLAKAKNDATGTRPKLAFDPKRIAQITAMLGGDIPHSVEQMSKVRGLFEAYTALYRMLGVIGREMPDEEANAA